MSARSRPDYLDSALRAAVKLQIISVEKVLTVRVVGDRAIVLAVTQNYLGPQVIGPTYTYFQCHFDEAAKVMSVDII